MRALVLTLSLLFAPVAAAAEGLALREAPIARGPAVTLGDLFENAGDAAGRAIGPAPAPGRSSAYSAAMIAAAARAAGKSWTPPEGVTQITVARAGPAAGRAEADGAARERPATGVRRGDTVTLTYVAPGLRLTTRARALADAAPGERVRLQNLDSNRTIEAIVTGPGAAAPAG